MEYSPGYMFLHLSCREERKARGTCQRCENGAGGRRALRASPLRRRARISFRRNAPKRKARFGRAILRTFKSTFERWCRILDRRASFWMNRHLPEPYFSTPLRRASSSSEDHCERCEGSQEVSASDVPWVTRRRFVGRSRREGGGQERRDSGGQRARVDIAKRFVNAPWSSQRPSQS